MNEELKKLFESTVLNEDTKEVLNTAFQEAIQQKEQELKTQYEAKVVEEKAQLMNEVESSIEEAVKEELGELVEEIEHARTLEVKYAEKLQEFKENYAEKYQETMKQQIDNIVQEEFNELKEDIEVAKKHEFVMQMFESFSDVYQKLFGGVDINIHDELEATKKELNEMKHEQKLNELLESLSGNKRDVARTILESVSLDKLETKFNSIKGILLAESDENGKDTLEESSTNDNEPKGKIVMESDNENKDESKNKSKMSPSLENQLRKSLRYAGVVK